MGQIVEFPRRAAASGVIAEFNSGARVVPITQMAAPAPRKKPIGRPNHATMMKVRDVVNDPSLLTVQTLDALGERAVTMVLNQAGQSIAIGCSNYLRHERPRINEFSHDTCKFYEEYFFRNVQLCRQFEAILRRGYEACRARGELLERQS